MDDETRDRFAHVEWRLRSLEARAWPDDAKPSPGIHRRLDVIEDTLRRIESALAHPPVMVTHTPVRLDGLDGLDARGDQVSWTEQQDPTTWAAKAARLTPDATPGIVDPDDRAALQRMADKAGALIDEETGADMASMIEGADASNARQPDQYADYWNDAREAHAAAVDARPESIRTPRKWWLLWLA